MLIDAEVLLHERQRLDQPTTSTVRRRTSGVTTS
jgi:hypothetical protein